MKSLTQHGTTLINFLTHPAPPIRALVSSKLPCGAAGSTPSGRPCPARSAVKNLRTSVRSTGLLVAKSCRRNTPRASTRHCRCTETSTVLSIQANGCTIKRYETNQNIIAYCIFGRDFNLSFKSLHVHAPVTECTWPTFSPMKSRCKLSWIFLPIYGFVCLHASSHVDGFAQNKSDVAHAENANSRYRNSKSESRNTHNQLEPEIRSVLQSTTPLLSGRLPVCEERQRIAHATQITFQSTCVRARPVPDGSERAPRARLGWL